MSKVTVDQIALFLGALPTNQTVVIWSPHGVGTSDVVKQYADEHNLQFSRVRLSTIDSADPSIPFANIPTEPGSILLLSDIDVAPLAAQALAYQIVLMHAVGSQPLPAGCRVVLSGTRTTDRGAVFSMPSVLANKLVHLSVKPDIVSWRKWAYRTGIDSRVISFLTLKPDLLHAVDAQNPGGAWPSPRSWAAVSGVLSSNLNFDNQDIAIAGCIGVEVAKEFARHCDNFEHCIRRVKGVLAGAEPNNVEHHIRRVGGVIVGTEPDYVENDPVRAVTFAIAVVASATNDPATLANILNWAKQQHEEYKTVVVQGLKERFGKALSL